MIIELSHLIQNNLPAYPGDAETVLTQSKFIKQDYYNNHHLMINMHAGTHIDGPMHLLDNTSYLNQFPLDYFVGDACVIDVSGEKEIGYKEEYEQLLQNEKIVVLYTGHSTLFGDPSYFTDYPVLTSEFAAFLIRKQVKLICLDTPSPDEYPFAIHRLLFENNILIAENLTNVEQLLHIGAFEVIALPLHIRADSSVARIIARSK